jgi:hypothetical protein
VPLLLSLCCLNFATANLYCPRGSALPTTVDPGFYTIPTGIKVKLTASPFNTTQSAQVGHIHIQNAKLKGQSPS